MKESTQTILVFVNYTDELEYSLKKHERSYRAGSAAPLRTHFLEICQEMTQGKNYQDFLSNTENKSQLRKDLIGCTTLNIEKDITISTTKLFYIKSRRSRH